MPPRPLVAMPWYTPEVKQARLGHVPKGVVRILTLRGAAEQMDKTGRGPRGLESSPRPRILPCTVIHVRALVRNGGHVLGKAWTSSELLHLKSKFSGPKMETGIPVSVVPCQD